MTKRLSIIIIVAVFLLSACGSSKEEESASAPDATAAETAAPVYEIAVMLPDESEHKWERSGRYILETFNEWNYTANIYYAENDDSKQAEQISSVAADRVDCIVLAAVDSYSDSIREAVDAAASFGIPVIAYDRLLMDTKNINIYVAYDPYLSGRLSGLFLEKMLGSSALPNIEIMMPERLDGSAEYFYSGAMDVLAPLIDAGRINVPSGLTSFGQTSAENGSAPEARDTMESILKNFYGEDKKPDGILAANDNIAIGAIRALEYSGYAGAFPIVTGMGCYNENILKLIEGKQAMSIFTDERIIAKTIAEAADQLVHGGIPAKMDRTIYSNGSKIVPSILVEPVLLDINNYKDLLIGGEYYSYTDINP